MEVKKNKNIINHSSAIEDILYRPPSWTSSYGTYVVIGVLLLALLFASILRYNNVVNGNVIITTSNPIVKINSKIAGEIAKVYVTSGIKVDSGQVLGLLKTTANYKDVVKVKELISRLDIESSGNIDSLTYVFPKELRLGSLQQSYLRFYLQHQELIVNDSLKPFQRFNENVVYQEQEQQELLVSKSRQLSFTYSKLKISKKNYDRSSSLLSKGVVSQAEHEKIQDSYLQMRQEYEKLNAEILQDKIALSKLQNLLGESQINSIKSTSSYNEVYQQAFQTLKNEIFNWEEQHVLKSPISGTVSLHNVWQSYQIVDKNEMVFSVVPTEIESVIGIVSVPIARSGNIEIGQKVIVRLSTYPSEQFGYLTGTVTSISSMPDQVKLTYTAFIDITSLTTSYGKNITLNQQMLGTAQIITEELSLLQRMFYSFRKLFDFNNAL